MKISLASSVFHKVIKGEIHGKPLIACKGCNYCLNTEHERQSFMSVEFNYA